MTTQVQQAAGTESWSGPRRVADEQAIASTRTAGMLLGAGTMASIDTALFHQFLQWHHFYVDTTRFRQIFSDGILQILTTSLLLGGALRLWSGRQRVGRAEPSHLAGSFLMGMGTFQLYDGIINHKILRLHPVRVGAKRQLPYDLAWNAVGAALLSAGYVVWKRFLMRGR